MKKLLIVFLMILCFSPSLYAKDAKDLETDYRAALSRYQQLKYLEETKNWDEYFAKGNDYRDEIVTKAEKVSSTAALDDPLRIYSRLLLYSFHKDQQDTFTEDALSPRGADLNWWKKARRLFTRFITQIDSLCVTTPSTF